MDTTLNAYDVLDAVTSMEASEGIFEVIATIAHERAENMRLKREGEWLRARIAQEDERLSHA